MSSIDQLRTTIRSLPLDDRLRLVERVVHDIVESPAPVERRAAGTPGLIGLFADSPELVDQACELAMRERERQRWREDGNIDYDLRGP